ncbi:MAG: ammonium transporter, partial [Methylacidiphilales bacterium]|nr:ammonium transporter [Candidatus Methylacidiphilales bacterium]
AVGAVAVHGYCGLFGGIAAGFALTGHFLSHRVYEPRGLPPPREREAFLRALELA